MINLDSILDAVRQHAAECAPKECCGLASVVRGKLRYTPCRNLRAGTADVFEIDPLDYVAVEQAGEIVAIVHSHVNYPPVPSMADLVGIEALGLPWLYVNYPLGTWSITEPSGFVAPLVGRPFVHGVLDCFALVRDYYKTVGVTFDNYPRDDFWWEKGQNLYLDNFAAAGFFEIGERDLRPSDAILMMAGSRVPNHAAIYLGDNLILQHAMNRLSSRDVWGGYWKKCATHFLRHRSLA